MSFNRALVKNPFYRKKPREKRSENAPAPSTRISAQSMPLFKETPPPKEKFFYDLGRQTTAGNDPSVTEVIHIDDDEDDVRPAKYQKRSARDLKIFIGDETRNDTRISKANIQNLVDLLQSSIQRAIDDPRSHNPAFKNSSFDDGFYKITCANMKTVELVETTINQNRQLWRGARLKVFQIDELRKFLTCKVWIPGPLEENEDILKQLKESNPNLCTAKWKILRKFGDLVKGQFLIINIDEQSHHDLIARKVTHYKDKTIRPKVLKLDANWSKLKSKVPTFPEIERVVSYEFLKVWIPGPDDAPEVVMARLMMHNNGLNTTGWKILRVVNEKRLKGQVIRFGIDPGTSEYIKNRKGKLIYGIKMLDCKLERS